MGAIAILGYLKNKYWLYFLGMCLAALSRNAFTLILPAILCTEILFFLNERKIKSSITRFIKGSIPILVGTGILTIIQYAHGSQSITTFLSVQKYWGHVFSFPNLLDMDDWAHESFAINIPLLVFIGIPLIVYLGAIFLHYCRVIKIKNSLFSIDVANKNDYAFIVSLFCCVSAFSAVLFTQGGNLHGLSRFVLASPYFIVAFLLGFDKISLLSMKQRKRGFIFLIILSCVVFVITPYTNFAFSYVSAFIFLTIMGLYLFQDVFAKKRYKAFLYAAFIVNVIWTTYLFNMYISNGWIFL